MSQLMYIISLFCEIQCYLCCEINNIHPQLSRSVKGLRCNLYGPLCVTEKLMPSSHRGNHCLFDS